MGLRLALLCLVFSWFAHGAAAQSCGGYTVVRGDSLSLIAERKYRNAFLWTEIYQTNRVQIGDNPDRIFPGLELALPCRGGTQTAEESAEAPGLLPLSEPEQLSLRFVASADMVPFAGPALPNGGLALDLMQKALAATQRNAEIEFLFVPSDGLFVQDPLPDTIDVVFPLSQNGCAGAQDCTGYALTAPLFELLTIAFVPTERPISLTDPSHMHGRTLCRAKGLDVSMLDDNNRNWLSAAHVDLRQPDTTRSCFEMLSRGQVDAVVANEFTGRALVSELALTDQVDALSRRPLQITRLHAAVRSNKSGAESVATSIDEGLTQMRRTGADRQLIRRHLLQTVAGL